ncbi:MAG TPA: hypothetical protein VM324_12545 [Egibacteraceae bacterium]|jgi:hypothetical protein|nr:hypothetical protein [Egibacteraceae bacterium]
MLDPAAGTWSHLPDAPSEPAKATPAASWVVRSDEAVLADGWLYRPAANQWTPIDDNPALADQGHATVLPGKQLFVWGGGSLDGTVSADGWL